MPKKRDIILVDIDGTLADITHRLHHLSQRPVDYEAFHKDLIDDSSYPEMVNLVNALHKTYHIILHTGRYEANREATEKWAKQHGISYRGLIMRKTGDKRSDTIAKYEALVGVIDLARVVMVIEDREKMVEMWRERGMRVLQCAPGRF